MTDTTTEPTDDVAEPSAATVPIGTVESSETVHVGAQLDDESEIVSAETNTEPDTFPRSVVEDLRKEAATYRTKAKDRDDLAAALWTARVEATGRLADPTDLPFPEDADPLDVEAVTAAVEDLLTRKPHLANRRPAGSVGQGITTQTETTDLAGILRSRA